jgi:hypothetical protein
MSRIATREELQLLSGPQRNYRASGKKLLPACSFNAFERDARGLRSMRELDRSRAQESASISDSAELDAEYGVNRDWSRMHKIEDQLSSRNRKAVWSMVAGLGCTNLGAAKLRFFRAIEQAEQTQRCMDADQRLYSYAI